MTTYSAHTEPSGSRTTPAVSPFRPPLVRAVFRDVTSLHVSQSAVSAASSVTWTVVTQIVDGAQRAAGEEGRRKLLPRDLISAIDRNVEVEVGTEWYLHSPTFHGLMGELRDAEGAVVSLRERRGARIPSGVAGAHRFRGSVRKLLRSRRVTAAPAMVRDVDGIASVFLTRLARDAAMVVREGGVKRYGTVTLAVPGEADPAPLLKDPLLAASTRRGARRTVDGDDVLAAATMQLFGELRRQALAGARDAIRNAPAV